MRRLVLVALLLAGACAPKVASSEVTGTVGRPANVIARDMGISAPIAGQVTWLFGDTIMAPGTCENLSLHDSTAATEIPDTVVGNVTEPVDPCGAPYEMVTPQVPDAPNGARTVFWAEAIVPTLDDRAAVFYQRVLLDGDVWTTESTNVDEMGPGETFMDRTDETVLFGQDERSYASGFADGGFVYLYATENVPGPKTAYYVARVPHALYRQRLAYTFWDGTGWNVDAALAAKVQLAGAEGGGLGGLTVSYNPYLKKYLMVHSQAFRYDLMLRTASSPQGPWSLPTHVDVPDSHPDGAFGNYSAREHPEFRSPDSKTLYLTYHRGKGWLTGELPVVKVVLK